MSIKDKIKSVWNKTRTEIKQSRQKQKNRATDSELAADEVIQQEVFPDKRTGTHYPDTCNSEQATDNTVQQTKSRSKTKNSAQKPPSKRSRPTNHNYEMIDPDNDTCDTGKS